MKDSTQHSRSRLLLFPLLLLALTLGARAATAAGADRENPSGTVGPDVTVFRLIGMGNYGQESGFVGYSVGTRSCNRGDAPLNWCDESGGCGSGTTSHDHPVIAQNLYRLKDGRFEQIGQSWLKHGFLSTNSSTGGCSGAQGQSCTSPPLGSSQLGVGCTDPYGSSLNGSRPLGRRSDVNAATGAYPFPYSSPPGPYSTSDQRIKVAVGDVDPALNAGALYFAEGQYVAPDDAAEGNGLNNASHQPVTVGSAPDFPLTLTGSVFETEPGIYAWNRQDAGVEKVDVDVPSSAPVERFIAARRATDLGAGLWHYEYAIQNLNSDRSGQALTVQFSQPTSITSIGFHDIDSHSGEPYDTTDWAISTDATSVTWSTDEFAMNADANALRWATMYSFWFDADAAPGDIQVHTLTLFKPGTPTEVAFWGTPTTPDIFSDGFESGDTSAWSSTVP